MADYDNSGSEEDIHLNTKNHINPDKCTTYSVLIVFVPLIAINIFGLIIGKKYEHAECYNNAQIMSLSTWLIGINAASLTVGIIGVSLIICSIITGNTKNRVTIVILGVLILWFGAFALGASIGGIIELISQFESCRKEVNVVCTVTLLVIVAHGLYPFGSCYGVYYHNKP